MCFSCFEICSVDGYVTAVLILKPNATADQDEHKSFLCLLLKTTGEYMDAAGLNQCAD